MNIARRKCISNENNFQKVNPYISMPMKILLDKRLKVCY
jgi:hypothetical protein